MRDKTQPSSQQATGQEPSQRSTGEITIRQAGRMDLLPEYVFGRLNAEKQRRRAAGVDIIDFGMGNPDMPASPDAVEKIRQVLDDEKAHRYARATGIPHLLRAVAEHYETLYGVGLDSETEIISTIGSKEGLSHLSLALLGPGDRCVVPEPYFPVHMWSAVIAGAEVATVPVTDDAGAMIRSLEQLQAEDATSGTSAHLFTPPGLDGSASRSIPSGCPASPRLLYLNYPHNPTGMTVDLSFFEEMVDWCRRHSVILIHDFAYKDITFGDYRAPSVTPGSGRQRCGRGIFHHEQILQHGRMAMRVLRRQCPDYWAAVAHQGVFRLRNVHPHPGGRHRLAAEKRSGGPAGGP